MNRDSRLFRFTVTLVRIAYIGSLIGSVALTLITLVAAAFPGFFAAAGANGLRLDAPGLKIDLSGYVNADSWKAGFIVSFGAGAVSGWAMLYIFRQLSAFLNQVGSGAPFSTDNAARITRIGIAVIAASLITATGEYGLGQYVHASVTVPGLAFVPVFQFPSGSVLLGLIILCLAEAFRYGARLQEEHDLTV